MIPRRPPAFPDPRKDSSVIRAFVVALSIAFALPAFAAPLKRSPLLGVPGGPTLAAEDTIPVPSALLPTVVVTAPRVSLDEILKRVDEGEAHRDTLMADESYTRLARITYLDADEKAPTGAKKKVEYASKVYKKRPNKVREIPLRRSTDVDKKKDKEDVQVSAGPSMREQIVSFAFEPRTRSRYHFRIDQRVIVGGHVVYVIAFTPRSKVDDLPEGRAWVDTNDFVIAREEFWYRDRSPAPLVFKRLDSCVVERTKVDGQWWVVSRVLARVQLTSAARMMAKLAREPLGKTVDFAASQYDWKINQGIDDALFAQGGKK
jgi:hypothetical protein